MPSIPFLPHPCLRGAHAQTLFGTMGAGDLVPAAREHRVELEDGDSMVLHEDPPTSGTIASRAALLVHGLTGDHAAGYMVRVAARLRERGYTTFRADLRGAGRSASMCRKFYHSGVSSDVAAAVRFISKRSGRLPIDLVGFSLGGNIILKYAAERLYKKDGPGIHINKIATVSAPADLARSFSKLSRGFGRFYNRYFTKHVVRTLDNHLKLVPGAAVARFARKPRTMLEIVEGYTAPVHGFSSALDYYEKCSSAPHLANIEIPTLAIISRDDPLVDSTAYEDFRGTTIRVLLTEAGGHMGFFAKSGSDPDRRWMDWRIVEWLTEA
ncbi:MAG: alpha/beta fold hydrolase [Planctomycetes bacterium]|nr:alpha/beta fold hydrolase [Planctomycetota bacterium]